MKILWLTEFFPGTNKDAIVGGVQARCFYVGNYLTQKNKLTVVEGVPRNWTKPSIASLFIRLIYFPLEIIRGLKIDCELIEASNFVMYFPAYIVAKLRDKPIIYWYPDVFLGSWVQHFGPVGFVGELVERALLFFRPDRYIAISEAVKTKLVNVGVPPSMISVVYCGVDIGQITKIRREKNAIQYDILAISRLMPYKRIEDLIRASAIIKKSKKSVKVAILGSGPQLVALKKLVEMLDLENNIDFINFLPSHESVLRLISSARIFCHPSIVEGFGIANIEAMSLGKPIVAADIDVINEITLHGKGSILFEPQNVTDLATAIWALLSKKIIYNRKRNEALMLSRIYNWRKIAKQTEQIYEEVLSV